MDRSNRSRTQAETKLTDRGAIHLGGVKRLAGALLILIAASARCVAGNPQVHLEPGPGGLHLVVGPIPEAGVLSILTEAKLSDLDSRGTLFFQTNTPIQGELRLPISARETAFFKATQWTGMAPALVEIPAGTFLMGTPDSEVERFVWEGPQTQVTLTRSFMMGRFEVTQAEYMAVMGVNPSYFKGTTNRPVENISWDQAMEYCRKLTQSQQDAGALPPGWSYRLPTEAEWEYACRAGTTTPFAFGPDLLSGMANFDGRLEYDQELGTVFNPDGIFVDQPTVVGKYAPNPWGLYDMHGGQWEWCLDFWINHFPGIPVSDPTGPTTGTTRVIRGGCWYNYGRICRSGSRSPIDPIYRGNEVGFRVVLGQSP